MITGDDARGPYSVQYNPAFRVGIVSAQQITPFPAVRVTFPDRDNVESYWLPISLPKVQADKFFWMPDIGEQVLVLMDEHDENGAVVGSLGSTVDTAPSWATANTFGVQFSDGTLLRYDRSAHVLTAVLGTGGTALIQDGSGTSLHLTNDGNAVLTGNLHVTGAVIAGYGGGDQVGLQTHTHDQPIDSHGDTEATTDAPNAGT